MTNFSFNGLVNSILPNIYINKVTLEGANAALNEIAANKEAAIDAHIDKRAEGTGGWTSNPTASDFTDSNNKLIVTYDLLLEVEELFDGLDMVTDDIFKYVKVQLITFKNEKGKAAYQHYISKKDEEKFNHSTPGTILDYLDGNKTEDGSPKWPSSHPFQLINNMDFKYTSRALDNIVENSMSTLGDAQAGLQNKRNFIKQKYQHILPDGRTIYKIPVRIKQELEGDGFPADLAAIAICRLDMSSMLDDLEDATGGEFEFWDPQYGRVASSVIIKNFVIPKQGMIFFISTDQENNKFDKIMGTLWFGGIHKHDDRFMAGNQHDPETAQPYLNYVMVNNNSVQDFRQIAEIKKQIFNFEAEKGLIFGGNYVNNQLTQVAAADFSNLACFGDLISTVNTKRQSKLLFSIDWGKLIKKYCMMPSLLDKLSNVDGGSAASGFLINNGVPNIKSFKIYRKRVDNVASSDVVNNAGRKLIYDGFPNIYYTGQLGNADIKKEELILEYNPPVKSALVPVKIEDSISKVTANTSHIAYYTFTDYDIQNISRGVFEYSLEVEIADPTLNYFFNFYNQITFAISILKPMVSFVNGGYNPLHNSFGQNTIFNSQTGQFTKLTQTMFENQGWAKLNASGAIISAVEAVRTFSMLAQKKPTFQVADLMALLNVYSGSPDSINVFSEILILVADKIKSIINSYSTVQIPKVHSFSHTEPKAFGGMPLHSPPTKKIKVEHIFKKPTELVHTTHSDGGYDFLAGTTPSPLPNITTAQIGLKTILSNNYITRCLNEFNQYFPNFNGGPFVLPVKIPTYAGPQSNQKLNLNLMPSIGMHLKVPIGGTHLPKYIVDHQSNNENEYWMVVNNILRYKMGLYGDTNSDHRLGYGPDDKIDGSLGINDQMERILKEYQTLAYRGIYFPQDSVVDPLAATDLASSEKKLIGDAPAAKEKQFSWDSTINDPLPGNAPFESLENIIPSDQLLKNMHVPWAQNYGQEKLLLSLINGTFIAPTVLDAKLGSFDPMLEKSILYKYVNNLYNSIFAHKSPGVGGTFLDTLYMQVLGDTAKRLQELPFHALALIANLNLESAVTLAHPAGTNPNPDFRYFLNGGVPQLYEKPEDAYSWEAIQNQDLKIDKFGQFWFNHMNVVEVQYLAGYEGVKNIPKSVSNPDGNAKKYEEVFNASAKAPIWEPLTLTKLNVINIAVDQATAKDSNIHLLCRLVKRKYDIFNTKAYEVLEMQVYDEYFLLTTQHQIENFSSNAYVAGFPDNITAAGTPGLQMEDIGPVAPPIAPEGFFDPEDTSGGSFSTGVPGKDYNF
jgi:hypothetical protein